jgi:Core-2/I-Branching enzyme
MMEAERRLLANALLDLSNERFILLSESHVPIFNFPTIYSYVINSTQVYLESYDEPGPTGRGRYQRHMYPRIKLDQWRKGSQWFEIDRRIAIDVISDDTYFPLFKKYCKYNCYTDEHYLPTLLHIKYRWALANRTLTWVDWSRGGPHPARFSRMEVTVDFLHWLRDGHSCTYNGKQTRVCFLFARKFLPNSLTRFLRFAPEVMGFG